MGKEEQLKAREELERKIVEEAACHADSRIKALEAKEMLHNAQHMAECMKRAALKQKLAEEKITLKSLTEAQEEGKNDVKMSRIKIMLAGSKAEVAAIKVAEAEQKVAEAEQKVTDKKKELGTLRRKATKMKKKADDFPAGLAPKVDVRSASIAEKDVEKGERQLAELERELKDLKSKKKPSVGIHGNALALGGMYSWVSSTSTHPEVSLVVMPSLACLL